MPNKDGTGPVGKGPKTGRQMGSCKDAEPIGGQEGGQGLGPCGQGRGRRLRRRFENKSKE